MREIWKTGFDLESASQNLTGQKFRKTKRQVISIPSLSESEKMSDDEKSSLFLKSTANFFGPFQDHGRYIEACRKSLIEGLAAGKFIAVGYRESNSDAEYPEKVPAGLFITGRIEWRLSTIVHKGEKFHSVRIRKAEDTALSEISEPELSTLKPLAREKAGRPTIVPSLREIVAELRQKGQLENASRKVQTERVRLRAKEKFKGQFPGEKQPSNTKILEALRLEGFGPPENT